MRELGQAFGIEITESRVFGNSIMTEQRKYLTEEELLRFLSVITSVRDRAIFTLLYWRGLRRSEVGRLELSAWRQTAGRLYVVRTKGSESGEYPLSPGE